MSTTPGPLRPARKPFYLTNVITVFALIFGMAFGICSVAGISLSRGDHTRTAHELIATALGMGAVCVICLIAVAVFAYIRGRCS